MEKMLVAYDGSEGADKALERAIFFAESGDEIILIAVITSEPTMSAYIDNWASESAGAKAMEHINQAIAEAKRLLSLAGKSSAVTGFVRRGNAAEEIIKAAQEFNSTLLLIGHRGQSKISTFPIGSVAEKVVRHAQVPVIVVR
jgi:nucleotide-binding universal stress UspA family protein